MLRRIRYPLFVLAAIFALTAMIRSAIKKRPHVVLVTPENTAAQVSEFSSVSATILNLTKGGIDTATATNDNVFLIDETSSTRVPATVQITASNVITLVPATPLKLATTYTLHITSGVEDRSGNDFVPFTSTFTTGEVATDELQQVKFEKLSLPQTSGQYTSLTIGPDKKLYALEIDGLIKRFVIKEDGTLSEPELLYALQDAYGKREKRLGIGFAFDPAATAGNLVAYVTHCSFMLSDGPDWDGKLTRLGGNNLQQVKDLIIHLPRSAKDHLTNGIAFGPDGALYFNQGSNSAMGSADKTWSNRDEHLLSAAVLRLDLKKLRHVPLNAKTKEGGGTYDPYAPDAPLTLYATGIRNAYDLVWHSNGQLYVPNNGSSKGGSTPSSVTGYVSPDGKMYTGPSVRPLKNVQQSQHDFLYRVEPGGYYGHPNPLRGEYVMNGGNPTPMADPGQVDEYPVGTRPDANWRGYVFDFQDHKSPNGVIEYRSNTFNGALKGKLLIVRYSTTNDVVVLTPGGQHGEIVSASEGAPIEGLSGFVMPLDLTEDTRTGNIYVAEMGTERITLLRPKAAAGKQAQKPDAQVPARATSS